MKLSVIITVSIAFLFLFTVTVDAVDIFQTNGFEDYALGDIDEQDGWKVIWNGCPSGQHNTQVQTGENPCEGQKHVQISCNRNGWFTVIVRRNVSTVGYEDIIFSYDRKMREDDWDSDGELYEIRWTSDGGQNWITIEEFVDNEDCDYQSVGPLPASAENNPDFAISFKLLGNRGDDEGFFDEVEITGCRMDGMPCGDASECCGGYCCPGTFPGGDVCSSVDCGGCADDGNPCLVDDDCCSYVNLGSGGCDANDIFLCFSCVSCSGVNRCSNIEPNECEYQCGADDICDDYLVDAFQPVGDFCYSCGDCVFSNDTDVGNGLCDCIGSDCASVGGGYCLNGSTNMCYYGIGCSVDGWNYTDSCTPTGSCGTCPGCEWTGQDCTAGGCVDAGSNDPDASETYCVGCGQTWSSGYSCCNGDDASDECAVDEDCLDECGETLIVEGKTCNSTCGCTSGTSHACDQDHYCNSTVCGPTMATYFCWNESGIWEWRQTTPPGGCGSDENPPTCQPVSANSTSPEVGSNVLFYTGCNDPSELGEFVFSWAGEGDCSGGAWYNDSQEPFDGSWANTTKVIPIQCAGNTVDYKFYVSDSLGNWGELDSDSIEVQVPTVPITTITSPDNGSFFAVDEVSVEYSSSDPTATTQYTIDTGSWSIYTNSSPLTFPGLSEGWHALRIKHNNTIGDGEEDNTTVFIDTIRPTLTISSPSEGSSFAQEWVVVGFTTTHDDVQKFEYSYDNQNWGDIDTNETITPGTTYTHNFTNVQQGSNTLYIIASDSLGTGNPSNINITITVPTYPAPEVTINYPEDRMVYESVTQFRFTVTDSLETSLTCRYAIDDEDDWKSTTATDNVLKRVSISVSDGDHEVIVWCYNGHKWTDPKAKSRFTVQPPIQENQAPKVTITWPENTTYTTSLEALEFRVTDDTAFVLDCQYSIDSSEWQIVNTNNNTLVTISEEVTEEGSHSLEVKCSDGVKEGTTSMAFFLNFTGSETNAGGPSTGNETNGTTVNETNQTFIPPDDYWVITDPRSNLEKLGQIFKNTSDYVGFDVFPLFALILMLIVMAIVGVLLYPRLKEAQEEAKRQALLTKEGEKEERCEELKKKKVDLAKKMKELKKQKKGRTKEYRNCKKKLDNVVGELLHNDIYLVGLYEKARQSLNKYYAGMKTEDIKKQLKKEGYTKKELEVIKTVFAREKLKHIQEHVAKEAVKATKESTPKGIT